MKLSAQRVAELLSLMRVHRATRVSFEQPARYKRAMVFFWYGEHIVWTCGD